MMVNYGSLGDHQCYHFTDWDWRAPPSHNRWKVLRRSLSVPTMLPTLLEERQRYTTERVYGMRMRKASCEEATESEQKRLRTSKEDE